MKPYIGRFAPTPSGPLHAGSLVAALASWLDARAFGGSRGKWLVRIEDVDTPRNVAGADQFILQQLHALGLVPDEPPVWQSQRTPHYEAALQSLRDKHVIYACTCSRKMIEDANAAQGLSRARNAELRYTGTCRHQALTQKTPDTQYSLRVIAGIKQAYSFVSSESMSHEAHEHAAVEIIHWYDRRLGAQAQNVQQTIGDFVLKRADGCVTYQLACVVDDALQGITHVVRGEDLADNTARQIVLQQHLGYAQPQYLHTPLVLAADGEKLSKQNGAAAVDASSPHAARAALMQAMDALSVTDSQTTKANHQTMSELLEQAVKQWRVRYSSTKC